MFNIFDDHTIR